MKIESTKIITTDDGTSTLYMDEYKQAMHTVSGAYEESLLKHIIPSNILNIRDDEINVLDIGFGLGYNILALMHEIQKNKIKSKINIVSLEKDESFFEYLEKISFNDERDSLYEKVKMAYLTGNANIENISIKIIFDDARKSIGKLSNKTFHTVFQDAFSPFQNPEMWSLEFFNELARIIKPKGIMTTYSCAPQIRSSMLESGFTIGRGPSVGNKKEGTIASLDSSIIPYDNEIIEELNLNIKSEPYRDPNFELTRNEILENRIKIIHRKKSENII